MYQGRSNKYLIYGHVSVLLWLTCMVILQGSFGAGLFFDQRLKCDLLVNNICESWNKYILEAREQGIISMLETIRRLVMSRLHKNKEQVTSWKTQICPRVHEKMRKLQELSRECIPHCAGPDVFEIDDSAFTHIVWLQTCKCDCGQWQISGIPCKHAISALCYKRVDPLQMVDECFHVATYKKVYEGVLFPVPHHTLWPEDNY